MSHREYLAWFQSDCSLAILMAAAAIYSYA